MALHVVTTTTFSGAHAMKLISGTGIVASSTLTGLEAAGTVVGIITGCAAILTLWVTITANNRAKRAEYEAEIEAAEKRGMTKAKELSDARIRELTDELTEARKDRDFYRTKYFENGRHQKED